MIVANNIIQWDIFFPSTRGRFLSIVIQLHYILANVYRLIYTPVSWLKAPLLSLRWALHDFKIYTICILGIDLQWSAPSFSQKFNLSNKLRMPTDSIGWPWLNTWPPSLERKWFFFNLSNKLPPEKIRCLEFVWSAASILGRAEKEIHKIKLWKLALVSCLLLEETQFMFHGDLGLCFAIIYPRYLLKWKPICINDSAWSRHSSLIAQFCDLWPR